MKFWSIVTSSARKAKQFGERFEAAGWDGLGVTDSQNLAGDAWVALAAMASVTDRLELGTSVTNPVTRHPAVTAAAALSVAVLAGDRVTIGIGRGDSALAHLGRAPVSVKVLEHYISTMRTYLDGGSVSFDDLSFSESVAPDVAALGLADTPEASRLAWLRDDDPRVSIEVASTGPKVIAAAARSADRIIFALGADRTRLAWGIETARQARRDAGLDPDGIEFGAYVNVVPHPDVPTAREMVAGGLSTFARFSVMHGSVQGPVDEHQREVMERLHSTYDMKHHTQSGSEQAKTLDADFIDSYAVVGPAEHCVDRLRAIEAVGIGKVIAIGPSAGSDRAAARVSSSLMAQEVIPAVRG